MVSQTCCHHADFRYLHSIVVLVRIFVVGSVFIGPMALAINLADLLIAWASPSIFVSDGRYRFAGDSVKRYAADELREKMDRACCR